MHRESAEEAMQELHGNRVLPGVSGNAVCNVVVSWKCNYSFSSSCVDVTCHSSKAS